MKKYTFYKHQISGEIAPLVVWQNDYESTEPDQWVVEGKLIPIELTSDGDASLTNRVFHLWYGNAEEGEEYISEWQEIAKDNDGNEYRITWQFDVIKGYEPYDDEWPWDDLDHIAIVQEI